MPADAPLNRIGNFQPIGYYASWGCFEFIRDEAGEIVGSREVEGWSGQGDGFSWEIRRLTEQEMEEMEPDEAS